MAAWQPSNAREPLVLNDSPEPTAGPGEAVPGMKGAGQMEGES